MQCAKIRKEPNVLSFRAAAAAAAAGTGVEGLWFRRRCVCGGRARGLRPEAQALLAALGVAPATSPVQSRRNERICIGRGRPAKVER